MPRRLPFRISYPAQLIRNCSISSIITLRRLLARLLTSPVAAPSYLQGIIEHFSQNDKTSKKNGILLAPKQGKKNLAKFLGIDMSALAEAEQSAGSHGKIGIFLP